MPSDLPSIDEPDTIIAHVNEVLGARLPDACIDGVVANSRLLSQHWDILRQSGDVNP